MSFGTFVEPELTPEILAETKIWLPGRDGPCRPHDVMANPREKYLPTYTAAHNTARALRELGGKVVYTGGTWDDIHIGHMRYLTNALGQGTVLIVAVELDSAVRLRKGANRPVTPFAERVETLAGLAVVSFIVPIADYDLLTGNSGMLMPEAIRPDVIVISKRSYDEADDTGDWKKRLEAVCGVVVELESQAETSTSARLKARNKGE